ncbi:MAG: hypothetical protein J3Q66DRAFT_364246 [Benniella sp.]|nr:MAG: hypothetical protein J3Q66DRAFT_364246 [Benniella sp.]
MDKERAENYEDQEIKGKKKSKRYLSNRSGSASTGQAQLLAIAGIKDYLQGRRGERPRGWPGIQKASTREHVPMDAFEDDLQLIFWIICFLLSPRPAPSADATTTTTTIKSGSPDTPPSAPDTHLRLPEDSGFESLYCFRISEEGHCTSKSANVNASDNLQAIDASGAFSHWATEGPPTGCNTDRDEKLFPGFWQDAKEHQMHWVFCCLGLMVLGSIICILMAPALVVWGHSAWNRSHCPECTVHSSSSTLVVPTALAIDTKRTGNHAHQSSLSSVHTSAGSIGSDSLLGSHESSPPRNLKSHFQHHYFHPSTSSSSMASPPPSRFAEEYPPYHHTYHSPQSPSPEYRESWYGTQSHDSDNSNGSNSFTSPQRPRAMVQRQGSASSTASSETVLLHPHQKYPPQSPLEEPMLPIAIQNFSEEHY